MGSVVTLHLLPHSPVQEYWLVGLVWCQVAAERLSTWLFSMGLAQQLGAKCTDCAQLLLCKLCGVLAGLSIGEPWLTATSKQIQRSTWSCICMHGNVQTFVTMLSSKTIKLNDTIEDVMRM